MKKNRIYIILSLLIAIFISCEKSEVVDKEKPEIDLTITDACPVNCDTLYFGEPFHFKALFTDNAELGSYSIDIHNNFDHHSHSTEVTECSLAAVKDPLNPYAFIEEYDIPDGVNSYEANLSINLPSDNENGPFDDGDYHFFISLTDKEGWSTQKGLSVKILHR